MAWTGKRPSAFASTIERNLTQRQKDIAAYAFQRLVAGSPVDQGAYRGNHRITINGRDYSFDETLTADPTAQGLGVIGGISQAFGEVVIQNNAPYAKRIEDGWSRQAGQGVYSVAYNSTLERFR